MVRPSILTKILLLALGLSLPPLVIVGWLALSSLSDARTMAVEEGSNALRSQIRATLRSRVQDKAQLYDSQLAAIEQQVRMVGRYAELASITGQLSAREQQVWVSPEGPTPENLQTYARSVTQARELAPIVSQAVENNPLVNLGYVALAEGGVVAFSDEQVVEVIQEVAPFEVRERPWYLEAARQRTTIWTDAYVDANSGNLVTTCATPIYQRNEELLGVIGFDLLLDSIQQDLLTVDIGEGGFAFLINERGDVLVRPDLEAGAVAWNEPFHTENLLTSSSPRLRDVARRMLDLHAQEAGVGVEQLEYENTNVFIAFAPIETAGWSVALVIPEDTVIEAPVAAIRAGIVQGQMLLSGQLSGLLIGMVFVVTFLGVALAHSFAQPIRALQKGAQQVAAGKLDQQLPPMGYDEIGQLVASFNAMTAALREKVTELEHNARQLNNLNSESNRLRAIYDLSSLYTQICNDVRTLFGFDRAVLYMVTGRQLQVVAVSFGEGNETHEQRFRDVTSHAPLLLDTPIVEADVVRTGQPVIVTDPWNNPRVNRAKQEISDSRTYAQVPILGNDGEVIGVISADYYHTDRAITQRDVNQLMTFATMAGLTITNVILYNDLERQVEERTRELLVALERAQLADRRKSEFLASVSHELRTPLNAIIGFSTVLIDNIDGPLSPDQQEDVESINRNGHALLHMINSLLDLARIEAGHLEIERAPLDLRELIGEAVETSAGLLKQPGVELSVEIPDDLPLVYADSGRVRQIVLNLLSNAFKFTDSGQITIQACCADDMDGRLRCIERQSAQQAANAPFVLVSVQDTGVGIAPEQQERVFEEFGQAHGPRSRAGGTGLGLAIVRRLVEGQGGRIWLNSVPGEGSTFAFTVPTVGHSQRSAPGLDMTPEKICTNPDEQTE